MIKASVIYRIFSLALLVIFGLGGSAAVLSNGRPSQRAKVLQDVQTPSVINEPPVAPHTIAVFPERDFISASGYDPAQGPVTVSVLRRDTTGSNLVLISSAQNVTPSDEGLVEVNHPGAA